MWTVAAFVSAQLCATQAATAQEPTGGDKGVIELGEIVVTALRKPTDVQRTAVALSVVSGEQLTSAGVTDIQRVADLVPALDVAPSAGPYFSFTVRGVNNFAVNYFSESAIAVNVDDVYVSRPTAFSGLFYDLERIEVLKGPQGTLYGRNATGGAVNVVTHKPTQTFGGTVNADVGDFGRVAVDASLNLPINETDAFRIAGQSVDRDGYFDDGTGDEKTRAGRISYRTTRFDDISIDIVGDYAHQGGRGGGSVALDPTTRTGFAFDDPWRGLLNEPQLIRSGPPTNTAFPPPQGTYNDNDFYGVSSEIEFGTSAGKLTVIPGYRKVKTNFLNVAGGFFINEQADSDQKSAEVRFASNEDQMIRYLVGAYYFDEDLDGKGFFDQTAQGVSSQMFSLGTESYAGFAQIVWAVTNTVRFTGGGRYTDEKKTIDGQTFSITPRFVPPAPPPNAGTPVLSLSGVSNSFSRTTYTAGLEWDVAQRSLLYANAGTGFKAGGFFSGPLGSNTFKPERVNSYTLGSKNRFLDNRLQLNAELFYLDYKDQQISHLDRRTGPGGVVLTVQATENVGHATTKGGELELEYLLARNTQLTARAQYLDATYDDLRFRAPQLGPAPPPYGCPFTTSGGFYNIDCSGKEATQSPKWTTDVGIQQRFPLSGGGAIAANLSSRYQSERETRINYLALTRADDYTRTNFSIGYQSADQNWSVFAYVDNIEDDEVVANTFVHASYPTVNLVTAALEPPRTYGVRVGYEF
jgi:iron complex outermembrane receptor protein